MAWLPLGEAVDRVLARLADNGKLKRPSGNTAARQVTQAGRCRPAVLGSDHAVLAKSPKKIRAASE